MVPSEKQIADLISAVREESSISLMIEEHVFETVEVEDIGPLETPSGVNPLPLNVPLLLINLDEMSNDIGSVLRASQGEEVALRGTVLTGVSLQDENLRRILFLILRVYRLTPDLSRKFTNRGLRGGTQIVLKFSRRILTEAGKSLLSKGLKFCPTPEEVDMYNLRKDIKEFTRRIKLREYFYSDENMDGDFSDMPAFRKKSN